MFQSKYGTIIILLIFIEITLSFEYYREKPSYIKTCKLSNKDLNECFAESIGSAFKQLYIGIPEVLEKIGPLDPYEVDNFTINVDTNLAKLKGNFSHVTFTGYSNMTFEYIHLNTNTLTGVIKANVPVSIMSAKYFLYGRVLLIPFNCTGMMTYLSERLSIGIISKKHLIKKDDFIFFNVTDITVDLNISKITVNYDNFFGDVRVPELDEMLNTLINENWPSFYEAVRPIVQSTLANIYKHLMQILFDIIPANFFIEDLPKSGELYAK